jgi:hypothetical protein
MKTKTNKVENKPTAKEEIFKNFDITFTTKDKYHPITRTVTVQNNKDLRMVLPTDKITIDKIEEVKEFKKEKVLK